jgi:hypothetical protein
MYMLYTKAVRKKGEPTQFVYKDLGKCYISSCISQKDFNSIFLIDTPLKRTKPQVLSLQFFFVNHLAQAPDNNNSVVSNFVEN